MVTVVWWLGGLAGSFIRRAVALFSKSHYWILRILLLLISATNRLTLSVVIPIG